MITQRNVERVRKDETFTLGLLDPSLDEARNEMNLPVSKQLLVTCFSTSTNPPAVQCD
jgi:hypothetical protein